MESPASIADSTMIGRSARPLISRARVRPSIRGIIMSMIRRSGQPRPQPAQRLVAVARGLDLVAVGSSWSASRTSRLGSSSTIRIRGDGSPPRMLGGPPESMVASIRATSSAESRSVVPPRTATSAGPPSRSTNFWGPSGMKPATLARSDLAVAHRRGPISLNTTTWHQATVRTRLHLRTVEATVRPGRDASAWLRARQDPAPRVGHPADFWVVPATPFGLCTEAPMQVPIQCPVQTMRS